LRANPPLLLIAGAAGATGSTVAAAIAAMKEAPDKMLPWLTTSHWFKDRDPLKGMELAGWDVIPRSLQQAMEYHGVLPPEKYLPCLEHLGRFPIRHAPGNDLPLHKQVEHLIRDIRDFKGLFPYTHPVLVNLLPASRVMDLQEFNALDELYSQTDALTLPDLAYVLAAISTGTPVVNFTSNPIELPLIAQEALKAGVPLCGRDGKTGQTYLKVVLASALKARGLQVDGWYSLNILGNDDGRNLADPHKAAGKILNKTELLEDILGYRVGHQHGAPCHKVVIDYYPPRGDCKEAWDVIDFTGLFGMPMSLRLNLQARDSILAAPMIIDLAWWMVAVHMAKRPGLVPELGFYFKKPAGPHPPVTFQDQLSALQSLEHACREIID
jgi:myo-inositol-1-phosphate synthase